MLRLTSRDNPRLKSVRSVRDGRDREYLFVEGVRLVGEVLRAGLKPREIFVATSVLANERIGAILTAAETAGSEIFEVPDKLHDQLSDTKSPQGLIAIVPRPENSERDFYERACNASPVKHLVLLHQVNNPRNVGAILRTAEATDVGGVILTRGSADCFAPKSLRAAMGATFRLNILADVEFEEVLQEAKSSGFIPTAADIGGKETIYELDWQMPRLIVFGNEGHGLSEKEMSAVEASFVIPMANDVESLNLAVATGIVLFESRRPR